MSTSKIRIPQTSKKARSITATHLHKEIMSIRIMTIQEVKVITLSWASTRDLVCLKIKKQKTVVLTFCKVNNRKSVLSSKTHLNPKKVKLKSIITNKSLGDVLFPLERFCVVFIYPSFLCSCQKNEKSI